MHYCSFTAPILKKGKQRDLQEKDVYKILPKFESENLGDGLEAIWNGASNAKTKSAKPVKRPLIPTLNTPEVSVFRCLVKKFGWYYCGLGCAQLVMRIAYR